MPPQLPLLLFILFILFLFRMDSKRKSTVSRALWIPLIWMIIIGSRSFSHWLDLGGGLSAKDAYLHGNPIDQFVLSLLEIGALYILFRRKIDWSLIVKSNLWITVFYLYCGISILWSDFPFASFKRWIKEAGNILMILVILTDSDPVEAVRTFLRRSAYVLILFSVLLLRYYPKLGISYDPFSGIPGYCGVTTSKNMLGNLCLLFGLTFFWGLVKIWSERRISVNKGEVFVHLILLGMIFWLFKLIDSRTSLVCFLISVGILISFQFSFVKKGMQRSGWRFFLAAFCLVVSLTFLLELRLATVVDYIGHADTFLGRVKFWPTVIDMMEEEASPLVGVGFQNFYMGERLEKIWEMGWYGANQSHNGYVETYIHLGLIGLFFLIGVIFSSISNILQKSTGDFSYTAFRLAILLAALAYNVTEAAFDGLHPVWFIFLLVVLNVPLHSKYHT